MLADSMGVLHDVAYHAIIGQYPGYRPRRGGVMGLLDYNMQEARRQRMADARAEAKYAHLLAGKMSSPKKRRSTSPKKRRSTSPKKRRSTSPKKRRSTSPKKRRSTSPKKPVRIVLKKEDVLARHGYADTARLSVEQRRAALLGAVGEFGAARVAKRLNVLAIFNRNKNPLQAAIFEADKQWVRLFALVRPGSATANDAAFVSARFAAGNRAPVRR